MKACSIQLKHITLNIKHLNDVRYQTKLTTLITLDKQVTQHEQTVKTDQKEIAELLKENIVKHNYE